MIPSTPVRQYIRKLAAGPEQLHAQSIVHKHDAKQLAIDCQKAYESCKGKKLVLKGHFHISTQKLCDAEAEAERDAKRRATKIVKRKDRPLSFEAESEEEVGEEDQEEIDGDIIDCITVDVE